MILLFHSVLKCNRVDLLALIVRHWSPRRQCTVSIIIIPPSPRTPYYPLPFRSQFTFPGVWASLTNSWTISPEARLFPIRLSPLAVQVRGGWLSPWEGDYVYRDDNFCPKILCGPLRSPECWIFKCEQLHVFSRFNDVRFLVFLPSAVGPVSLCHRLLRSLTAQAGFECSWRGSDPSLIAW